MSKSENKQFPEGSTRMSLDGIKWIPLDASASGIRFVRTKAGEYYRRPRIFNDWRDYKTVTKAHVDTAARERWYAK